VDNGISSHEGVDYANECGILVLITDHHLPGKILPNATAIVNPNIGPCLSPLQNLAGVGVAFYLMVALRAYLRQKNWFNTDRPEPNLASVLDLVALGTISDAVSLNFNNRILVWQGLCRMRLGKCRVGISALIQSAGCNPRNISTSDLGFVLAPHLNAAGRLDNMSLSVQLLLTNDANEAAKLVKKLKELNKIRKKLGNYMMKDLSSLEENRKNSLCFVFYNELWHQGLIGILASRLSSKLHHPVIIFAKVGKGLLKGSGRSIPGVHLYEILQQLDKNHPEMAIDFGGHSMAVGLLLREKKSRQFSSGNL
jgi:single-stranded-DNA-specific exonuclease